MTNADKLDTGNEIPKMTYGDMLRALPDRALAKFIFDRQRDDVLTPIGTWEKWLKKEAKYD